MDADSATSWLTRKVNHKESLVHLWSQVEIKKAYLKKKIKKALLPSPMVFILVSFVSFVFKTPLCYITESIWTSSTFRSLHRTSIQEKNNQVYTTQDIASEYYFLELALCLSFFRNWKLNVNGVSTLLIVHLNSTLQYLTG